MRNNIPVPNPAVTQILKSTRMQQLVAERAERAQVLYQQIVAKRTRTLAGSAHVETYIGGRTGDRWCARLTVGDVAAYYAASHEYGTDNGDLRIQAGARDLNVVLNAMGTL